jgi:hypothetical protein
MPSASIEAVPWASSSFPARTEGDGVLPETVLGPVDEEDVSHVPRRV